MLENKLLIEPTDTPQLSNQNMLFCLYDFFMLFGSHINFFLIKDEIDIYLLWGLFSFSSPVNFHDSEQNYSYYYYDYRYKRTYWYQ